MDHLEKSILGRTYNFPSSYNDGGSSTNDDISEDYQCIQNRRVGRCKWKQLWLAFSASLGFLIMGLLRGYSASAIPSIEEFDPTIAETTDQKSWIGAVPALGGFTGCLLSGPLMQKAGRRRGLLLTAPFWAIAWLVLGFAPTFPIILLGRVMTGLGVGLMLAPSQVYVSECCDPEIRGRLGSLPTLSMSLGIVISYVAGSWLYWRHLAFLSVGFCGAFFLALLPLPESPVWLEAQGCDASASIKWLHLSSRAAAAVKKETTENVKDTKKDSLLAPKVLFSSSVIKPLLICYTLLIFQQFSGIDAIIFFTVEIFKTAGSKLNAMTATILVGVVQLVCNGISTTLVDRCGRRPLLMLSAAIMVLSNAAMGAAFFFELSGYAWLGYLPVASLLVFVLGFSIGFGGLPFVLLGELFPAHYRSQLSSIASAVNLLSMFVVIKTYHSFDALLTSAGTFWLYACFCALALVFVFFVVPETKGKTLVEIEQHFRSQKNNLIETPA